MSVSARVLYKLRNGIGDGKRMIFFQTRTEDSHGSSRAAAVTGKARSPTADSRVRSGVTRRGEVRQLPQGAKRQGALLVDGLFALHYRIQPNF